MYFFQMEVEKKNLSPWFWVCIWGSIFYFIYKKKLSAVVVTLQIFSSTRKVYGSPLVWLPEFGLATLSIVLIAWGNQDAIQETSLSSSSPFCQLPFSTICAAEQEPRLLQGAVAGGRMV